MNNSLLSYFNKRLSEDKASKKDFSLAGPVITISRQVGCNGLKLAQLISTRLNTHKLSSDWRVLSKEIFSESARELDMNPEQIRRTITESDKYTFQEILKAFSDKGYKSERKIIKTVSDVIRTFAIDGFCIIVGRASHIIAKDIKNSLHLRLIAPMDYRVRSIMHSKQFNHADAIEFIEKMEKEREAFRNAISPDNVNEDLFDLTVNTAMFSNEEIVDIIEYAVNKKKILQNYKSKTEFF